jgi:predicted dehydrogenase
MPLYRRPRIAVQILPSKYYRPIITAPFRTLGFQDTRAHTQVTMSKKSRLHRRDFLKRSTAAALGAVSLPTIVPASVLGAGDAVPPSERITLACIGWGQMGPNDTMQLIHSPEIQVVAVCDVDQPRAIKAKKDIEDFYTDHADRAPGTPYVGCDTYGDFREVLARNDIDAVVVATPDHWHAIIAIAAARAGKDIYCEKPMSLTVQEGREMVSAVERYGRVLQVGSQSRSIPNIKRCCELALNGYIGEVHTVRVGLPTTPYHPVQPEMPIPEGFNYDMWLGPAPWAPYTEKRCHVEFRWILEYSDGMIADWGAHQLDIAQWGLGMQLTGPVEIEGQGVFPRDGLTTAATTFELEMKYANGVRLICSTEERGGATFEGSEGNLYGSHGGAFEASDKRLETIAFKPTDKRLYADLTSPEPKLAPHRQNFIDCVRTRKTPIAPVEVGHRTATVCHLANIAMLRGRKIRWDPQAEHIVDDPIANRMLSRPKRAPWDLNFV